MKLPLLDFSNGPTVKIGKMRGTIAQDITHGLFARFHLDLVVFAREIRLGNWNFKSIHSGMAPLSDEELTVTALNEEYLHEAIFNSAGSKTSKKWDNFPFDLRAFINGVQENAV